MQVEEKQQTASRSYTGQDLRGRNFKGQNLAGEDFSGADIRGARFVDADLQGAKFREAKAGVQKQWLLIQLLLIVASVTLLNFIAIFFNAIAFSIALDGSLDSGFNIGLGISFFLLQLFCLYAVGRQGLTSLALSSIFVAIVATVAATIAFAFVFTIEFAIAGLGAFAGALAGAIAVAIAVLLAVVGTFAGAIAVAGAFARTAADGGAIAVIIAFAGAVSVAPMTLAWYIARRVLLGDERFALARALGLGLSTIMGTTFAGANLTDADFSKANLKNTNFDRSRKRDTLLKHVIWDAAKQLEKAKIDQSVLADSRVRQLLLERTGFKQNYDKADLHEANLSGVYLEKSQLHRADLNHATCRDADFSHAILTEVQAIGTDFTNANLSGACIENWNIDETTILNGVRCDYIYLKYNPDDPNNDRFSERRPHNPDKTFQPGDFEKLYKQVMTTVELLFRNGIHPESFAQAFQQLTEQYPEATLQKLERKDADILVTLEVPKAADKAEVERNFDATYDDRLEAAKNAALLEAERQHSSDLKELALALAKKDVNLSQMNQTNMDGVNSQNQARDSTINQAQEINIDSEPGSSPPADS